jgi:DNA ligase (NAD+)
MEPLKEIEELRKELNLHNYNYYVLNNPVINDQEFDEMMHRLQLLEKAHPESYDPNSPTQRVGSDLNHDFAQVVHRYPMLSLANTYNKQEVEDFYQRVKSGLNGDDFEICCEIKFDGLSISLIYEQGKLTQAVTRGDGVRGDDVTANVKTIRAIPLQLMGSGYPDFFEMRGEVLMPWDSFEQLNREREEREEPLFANPRNAASGTLKSKTSAVVAKRKLDSYVYYFLGDTLPTDGHYENLMIAKQWGFKIFSGMKKVKTLKEIFDFIAYWDEERKNLPVATDGIVLKVNSLKQQQLLGNTAKNPRWAIAYKFQAERACTRLNEVTFQVGRTGAITPVANMDPVQLSGTVVKRATLHNADIMEQLDLHINDMVYVEKGGEIIPKIVGVNFDARGKNLGEKVKFITHCPECGTPLVRYENEAAHYCPNDTGCPPQIKGKIEHYISRKAMNIDSLGPETVDDYYQRGLIHDVADLYDIDVQDINGADGAREKSAQKIVHSIAKSTEIPFERVLFALGIRFVGETVAKIIARHFKNIDAIASANIDDLLQVSGVGTVIAQSVINYFRDEKNNDIVSRLRQHGVQMSLKEEDTEHQTEILLGKNIVISGVFESHSREEYKMLIERNGGKNVSSISSKTSFILAGANMGPSKLAKAQELGIQIIDETTFLNMIGEQKSSPTLDI